jgi:pyruvate/2-oxoglutarate dehydrogenase complex dihydrolipoamide dehydrogenase (E3) component
MLGKEQYDVVMIAAGARPIIPPIPGVDGKNVVCAQDIYGHENALAQKVVIIGGGEVGVETGIHLARMGREVTLLEMGDKLAPKAPYTHFYNMLRAEWEKLPNFKYVLKARCKSITDKNVAYTGSDGQEHAAEAGSVILAVGMQPENDLALRFYGIADRFFMIGDCDIPGSVQTAIRNAFSNASTL